MVPPNLAMLYLYRDIGVAGLVKVLPKKSWGVGAWWNPEKIPYQVETLTLRYMYSITTYRLEWREGFERRRKVSGSTNRICKK